MRALRIAGFAVIAGLSASAPQSEVRACALAPPAGQSVHIAEESALIIWDAATKTQHFIRRAQFDTKAKDFGFLVPTPARPELSEVNDAVFSYLLDITRPPVREVVRSVPESGMKIAVAKSAPAPAVIVLETATVAGFDAVVLAANDAQALNRWLRDHGYASSPELAEWFKPYVSAKWIMTAFKISKGQSPAERAVSSAVRMSFKTDLPFFPYREPATKSTAPRALEVYFISGERVEGRIGAAGRWPGQALWAKPLGGGTRKELLDRTKLPANAVPDKVWLTRFLDSSAPRPGTDELFFTRASSQSEYIDADRLESELLRKQYAARSPAYGVATSGNAGDMYKQAQALEKDGRALDAIRVYRRAARAGNGQAAKRLGEIFEYGAPGVSRDFAESLQWYQTARDLGVAVKVEGKR